MSYLAKSRKIDLLALLEELSLQVPTNNKIPNLVKTIVESEDYDEEMTKNLLNTISSERENKEQKEKYETEAQLEKEQAEILRAEKAEKEKLEREFQIEKLKLEIEAKKLNTPENMSENKIGKNKELLKMMAKYTIDQDMGVYLNLFERQIARTGIPKSMWPVYLQTLMPIDIVSLIAREEDEIANNYDEVRKLLLVRFKLNFEEYRQKFCKFRKDNSISWRDMAFHLSKYFDEWTSALDIKTMQELRELIITDQLKKKIPFEAREHMMDDLPRITKLDVLVKKLEDFDIARDNLRKPRDATNFGDRNNKMGKFNQTASGFKSNTFKGNRNFNNYRETKPGNWNKSNYSGDDKNKIYCHNCKAYHHRYQFCPKTKEKQEITSKTSEDSSNVKKAKETNGVCIKQPDISTNKIKQLIEINGKEIYATVDTGSEISIVTKEVHKELGAPILQQDQSILFGIENNGIKPLGKFLAKIKIHDCEMITNIYVLEKMKQNMLMGLDIILQKDFQINQNGLTLKQDPNKIDKNMTLFVNDPQLEIQTFTRNDSQTHGMGNPKS